MRVIWPLGSIHIMRSIIAANKMRDIGLTGGLEHMVYYNISSGDLKYGAVPKEINMYNANSLQVYRITIPANSNRPTLNYSENDNGGSIESFIDMPLFGVGDYGYFSISNAKKDITGGKPLCYAMKIDSSYGSNTPPEFIASVTSGTSTRYYNTSVQASIVDRALGENYLAIIPCYENQPNFSGSDSPFVIRITRTR